MQPKVAKISDQHGKIGVSRLFEKLNDPKTGLYFQSSGYVYSYLQDELDNNKQKSAYGIK